jgi:actin-related protein 3
LKQSDGYVIGSCIKHIPLAGRDISNFIASMIRERGEKLNNEDINRVATEIKQKYGYVC